MQFSQFRLETARVFQVQHVVVSLLFQIQRHDEHVVDDDMFEAENQILLVLFGWFITIGNIQFVQINKHGVERDRMCACGCVESILFLDMRLIQAAGTNAKYYTMSFSYFTPEFVTVR